MSVISIYDSSFHSSKGGIRDIELVFEDIRIGTYKTQVEEIRIAKYNFKLEQKRCEFFTPELTLQDLKYQKAKTRLKELKDKIHRVTISGKFSDEGRGEKDLINHSGYIDIDIDGLTSGEIQDLKTRFQLDEYCQATFVTCGGDGLSFIARIDPGKHNESWEGLYAYFFNKYHLSIDKVHKNVSNTRNVSYDPTIFVKGSKAKIFKEYPKEKKRKEVKNFVYAKTDFELAINEIVSKRVDFCDTYENYLSMGFAIASKFAESGLEYFDSICSTSQKYNQQQVEKDYIKYFCKNPNGGISIASFFGRCKDLGIDTSSEKTKRIAIVSSAARKGGKTKEDTKKNLVKFEDFKADEIEDIVNQIFDDKIDIQTSDTLLDEIETYLNTNYYLRKNLISGKLENDGVEWNEEDLNGCLIAIKKAYDSADAKWIERIIFSPAIKSYNPIREWFLSNLDKMPDELLEKGEIPQVVLRLCRSIETDNPKFLEKYLTKWLVSIVASAFGQISNLELCLTGKMNKGKTYFFKYLLPKQLLKYFAESKLDSNNANDDYTSMCQKLLMLMDEGAGKTRADEKKHRNLLDKDIFTIRRPYRKDLEDMQRLAVLCVTSNPQNLLQGDNRRIIPINMLSRNFKEYDDIDKDELFMALYYLWKNGFDWKIGEDDIPELHSSTTLFQTYELEYELIAKYFDKGDDRMTASEIKIKIDNSSGQKTKLTQIIKELNRIGFKSFQENIKGIQMTTYAVRFKGDNSYVPGLQSAIEIAKNVDYF